MPFTQIATEKKEYMLFIGDGSLRNQEELFQWCVTSIGKARASGLSRLLYDNRTLSLEMTQHDIMMVSDKLLDLGIPLMGLRFAVLSSVKTSDVAQGVETAFANRSAAYRRFDSQKEALEWLLG